MPGVWHRVGQGWPQVDAGHQHPELGVPAAVRAGVPRHHPCPLGLQTCCCNAATVMYMKTHTPRSLYAGSRVVYTRDCCFWLYFFYLRYAAV